MLSSSNDDPHAEHASTGDTAPALASPSAQQSAEPEVIPLLQSEALLQGCKRVHIAHNGARYQLQATRQGKLILTK